MTDLQKQVRILEKNLSISQRNRARLEDVREKNQRMLETVNTELAEALDELQHTQASLIQSEKMAALGQLTGGIAHEIKNPLNFINNFAKISMGMLTELQDLLARPLAADPKLKAHVAELLALLDDNLTKITNHGDRADQIVKNMLAHSHQGTGELRRFNFNEMLNESAQLAYHGARAKDPDFHIDMQQDLDPSIGDIDG